MTGSWVSSITRFQKSQHPIMYVPPIGFISLRDIQIGQFSVGNQVPELILNTKKKNPELEQISEMVMEGRKHTKYGRSNLVNQSLYSSFQLSGGSNTVVQFLSIWALSSSCDILDTDFRTSFFSRIFKFSNLKSRYFPKRFRVDEKVPEQKQEWE